MYSTVRDMHETSNGFRIFQLGDTGPFIFYLFDTRIEMGGYTTRLNSSNLQSTPTQYNEIEIK